MPWMNVLVVGGGAREHALAWKVAESPLTMRLYVAPGNAGTAQLAGNVPIGEMDFVALVPWAREHAIDLAIIGPDDPLAAGIVDAFAAAGLRAFGPTAAAAAIEASKSWAKDLMAATGIPTAPYRVFDTAAAAHHYLDSPEAPVPLVVKADGLARGKGTFVCRTRREAHATVESLLVERALGAAGQRVVVEACLSGPEVSVFALSDGETVVPLGVACDYKRLGDGDTGPNTGGMGAYSPTRLVPPALMDEIEASVLRPAVRALAAAGRPYRGVLYAGLMLTDDGVQVLEFNARFGDPEAQVILPRLESDLGELALAAAEGRLPATPVRWRDQAAVGVVLASGGYPDEYRTGLPILGLEEGSRQPQAGTRGQGSGVQETASGPHIQVPAHPRPRAPASPEPLIFHAGTRYDADGKIVTAGGRVLTVVGLGTTLAAARAAAYERTAGIRFEGAHFRRDIALRET